MNKRIRKVLEQPLHRFLGISAIESEGGRGKLSLTVSDNAVNPAGMLHGGVVYTLCDVCAYGGLLSVLDDTQEAVTHDIHVSVMQAVKKGDVVVFESQIVKMGKRICFIDVTASVMVRRIATARITKSLIPIKNKASYPGSENSE